jgi:hypothetical protein
MIGSKHLIAFLGGSAIIFQPLSSFADGTTTPSTIQSAVTTDPSTKDKTLTVPPIPNSSANYLGDIFVWDIPVEAWPYGVDGSTTKSPIFCLPAGTHVVAMTSALGSVTTQDSSKVASAAPQTATTLSILPVKLNSRGLLFGTVDRQKSLTAASQQKAKADSDMCPSVDSTSIKQISTYTEFYVSAADVNVAAYRAGWDYGTLVVPFKFQLSGKHSLTGSATIGAYAGYRLPIDLPNFSFNPIIFAGASQISTSATTGTTTTSQTVAGLN